MRPSDSDDRVNCSQNDSGRRQLKIGITVERKHAVSSIHGVEPTFAC